MALKCIQHFLIIYFLTLPFPMSISASTGNYIHIWLFNFQAVGFSNRTRPISSDQYRYKYIMRCMLCLEVYRFQCYWPWQGQFLVLRIFRGLQSRIALIITNAIKVIQKNRIVVALRSKDFLTQLSDFTGSNHIGKVRALFRFFLLSINFYSTSSSRSKQKKKKKKRTR